jgi:hypothetical protein
MTQEIKIILTFKEKEYLNIKSSEGNTCPWKKLYMWAQSLSCSACFRKPSTYTCQIISQRNCNPTALDSVTERNNSRKIINGELLLRSVHYKRRNRVFCPALTLITTSKLA